MYSEGAFGSGRAPSANLMATSHDPTAEKYNSDDDDVSTSCAVGLSLCSATTPQRKTLVSSRNFMPSVWLFSRASVFVLRIDQASHPAGARQNHLVPQTRRE